MNSRIHEIVTLLPPPKLPKNNIGDWRAVATDIGIELPRDFKDFTELYGSVKFCDYLFVHTPFPWSQRARSFRLDIGREYDAIPGGRTNVPYPDFPNTGGLLVAGATDNGDLFSWITEGDPDEWGIFFWVFPGLHAFTFRDLNLTGFLAEILSLRSPLFPDHLPEYFFGSDQRHLIVTD